MTNQEKMEKLEEILELEAGSLAEETVLETLNEWDSMAALSLIVLMDEDYGKKLTGQQIREFTTIQDILNEMG